MKIDSEELRGASLIQRCPHDRENPYCMISREMARDKSLSFEAKGMLLYLLSMKDSWTTSATKIAKEYGCDKGKIMRILNKCIAAGYVRREVVRDEKRRIYTRYFVSEEPKFKKIFPRCILPRVEKCTAGSKGSPYIQEITYKELPPIYPPNGTDSASPQTHTKMFVSGSVKMPEKSYKELCKDFGEPAVTQMISQFQEYAENEPKKFAKKRNHALTLRNWLNRNLVTAPKKECSPRKYASKPTPPKVRDEMLANKSKHLVDLSPPEGSCLFSDKTIPDSVLDCQREVFGLISSLKSMIFQNADKNPSVDTLRRYMSKPTPFLTILGSPGCGKTSFVSALYAQIRTVGYTVLAINEREFLDKTEECHAKKWEWGKYLKERLSQEFLILDDVGSERTTPWKVDYYRALIDFRSRKGLHTIITSNVVVDDLDKIFTDSGVSRLLGHGSMLIVQEDAYDLRFFNQDASVTHRNAPKID